MHFQNISKDDYLLAYIDISGFKNMMEFNKEKSMKVLNDFYQKGYNCLEYCSENPNNVVGQFFSDMGILISKNKSLNIIQQFNSLLNIIVAINKQMFNEILVF